MFVVTNREIRAQKGGVNVLGATPNVKGPNELCLVEATKRAGKWQVEVLPDEVPLARLRDIGKGAGDDPHVAGYVAERLLRIVNPRATEPNTRRRTRASPRSSSRY